jgi:hypothetical protein
MVNNKKIIDKICKCFRLSESSNPNEAALALRQAISLMEKYGVNETQLISAGVNECAMQVGEQYSPPFWALALANLVADAFQCRNLVSRSYGRRPEFRFIGLGFKAEIATYSYTVLHRYLLRAIEEFESSVKDEGANDEMEARRRIDVFTQAWLFRAGRAVTEFSENDMGKDVADKDVVEKYIKEKYGNTVELTTVTSDINNADYSDILNGMRAANKIVLYPSLKCVVAPALAQHKHAS